MLLTLSVTNKNKHMPIKYSLTFSAFQTISTNLLHKILEQLFAICLLHGKQKHSGENCFQVEFPQTLQIIEWENLFNCSHNWYFPSWYLQSRLTVFVSRLKFIFRDYVLIELYPVLKPTVQFDDYLFQLVLLMELSR